MFQIDHLFLPISMRCQNVCVLGTFNLSSLRTLIYGATSDLIPFSKVASPSHVLHKIACWFCHDILVAKASPSLRCEKQWWSVYIHPGGQSSSSTSLPGQWHLGCPTFAAIMKCSIFGKWVFSKEGGSSADFAQARAFCITQRLTQTLNSNTDMATPPTMRSMRE